MWPFVNIVQDGMLGSQNRLSADARPRRVQPDLHHVAGADAAALGHAVDERLVQVEDERLEILRVGRRKVVDVRRLAARDERPRRRRRLGVLC